MLIVGAKGFAKEVLQIVEESNQTNDIYFFDDLNKPSELSIYGKYPILDNLNKVKELFENNNSFTIGIGKPYLRKKMHDLFVSIGGVPTSISSLKSYIGKHAKIQAGSNILAGVKISNDVTIGLCSLIYYNSIITHDCVIGDFVEISPSVNVLGNVKIGDFTHLGSNSTILANITIGKNSIVGAGSVVTKDIPDNCIVVGIPAKIIKENRVFEI